MRRSLPARGARESCWASLTRKYSSEPRFNMRPFDFQPRTRVVFREGGLALVGQLARSLEFTRTLIVADQGILSTGFVEGAVLALAASEIVVFGFHDFDANPDAEMVESGCAQAAE